jgi:hypothetical protein
MKKLKYICECGKSFGWEKNLMKHQAEEHMKKIGLIKNG